MIKHLIIFVSIGFTLSAQAQFVSNYKRAGDQFYAKGDYYSAAQYYEKYVDGKGPGNTGYEPYLVQKQGGGNQPVKKGAIQPELAYRLADSYFKLNDFSHAEPWYKVVMEKYASAYPQAGYYYAVCLRANGKYDEAIQVLQQYKTSDEAARHELEVCHFIKQQLGNNSAHIEKLNGNINTEGANYAAAWPDASTMVFTSTRGSFTNALYKAPLQSGGLGEAEKINFPYLDKHQLGTPGFTPDGNKMFFTAWTVNKEGKKLSAVYMSEKNGQPVLITDNARHPQVTPDGKYLLLASDRAGSLGGLDIWYAPLNADGRPGKLENMGTSVNTASDEEAPFYHAGSNTLVFASKGRTGMGGFDLFASTGSFGSNWSEAVNLGHPVNSVKDDSYFTGKGKFLLEDALISSDRSSVCCLELFAVHKKYKQYVTGQVTDCATQLPLSGVQIVATDAQGNRIAAQTTGSSGSYVIEADAGLSLQISGEVSGYQPGNTKAGDPGADTVYAPQLCLTKVPDPFKGKATLVTRDIYFAFAKTTINENSYDYLDQMAAYLKANPAVRIEIAAYTDGIGTVKANQVLSQGRADAVLSYLVNAGVQATQLVAKGYGECCPIEKETVKGKDNPSAREKNRRVEFKILP